MCSASVSLICRREVGHVNGWLLTERASLCWSWVVCPRVLVCVHLRMDYFGSSLLRQLLATGGRNTRHQQALIKLTSALKSTHSKAVSHIFRINTAPSTMKMTKKYHPLCALHNLTSSGSSLRLLRCSFQDPSCGGGEVTANGGRSARGRSAAAPLSLCLWPLLQLLRLRLHHHRHCPVLQ